MSSITNYQRLDRICRRGDGSIKVEANLEKFSTPDFSLRARLWYRCVCWIPQILDSESCKGLGDRHLQRRGKVAIGEPTLRYNNQYFDPIYRLRGKTVSNSGLKPLRL
ncbi:MAG: hypothetical protein WBA89_16510 [Microcoleus sp.]|uniref:hypothetical protein n=1 Tax=Microcoleus sp. TaxID=44472 RepID=UPI003C74A0C5